MEIFIKKLGNLSDLLRKYESEKKRILRKKNIILKILESYKEIKRREERIRDNLEKLILIITFVK